MLSDICRRLPSLAPANEYSDEFVRMILDADAMTTGEPMSSEAYDERLKELAAKFGLIIQAPKP